MPTDIIKETDRTTYSDNLSDELYPKVIDSLKSIWLECNNENDKFNINNSILKSSDSCNSDYFNWHTTESFLQEVQSYGFIIGTELENVKAKSRRSLMQQMSNHISKNFQSLYGKENNGVRQNYFQIGVRVPSKEHVSEIVGKQGLKIKEIRETTGALIITPGESEDHVFIIEATPPVALEVAKFIDDRANEITANRARDTYQKSLIYNMPNRFCYNKPFTAVSVSRPILATGVIEVPKNIVGRIIGTHGSIITTIQKDTGTEIRSPPKDNHLSGNNNRAKFEILVYQKSNSIDVQEANQRIKNAKQLIAHVAMHQMERIRAEESPFSNYRIKNFSVWESADSERNTLTDKEKLLNYQMQSVAWMWTDIDRLDDQVSEEVVLRILEESKKKSKLRTDYGNIDGLERFDESSFHQQGPFKPAGSFGNIYDSTLYSPSIYSELGTMMKPTSPNHLNGTSRECLELSCCPINNFVSASINDVEAKTTSSILSRPSSVTYKTSLHGNINSDHVTSKSYAEHFKSITTASNYATTNIINSANPTTFIGPASIQSATTNHGVIGDHIRKVNNYNKTAQFHKI